MIILAIIITLCQAAACIGLGLLTMRTVGGIDNERYGETLALSFAVGVGLLGWLMFFLGVMGMINVTSIAGLMVFGVIALIYCRDKIRINFTPDIGRFGWTLVIVCGVIVLFDLIEALSPAGDADSLTYHFALPKKFIEAGQIIFEPRVVDGAVPLLVQMTYIPALALGGEHALTMWTFISALGASILLFVISRRYLNFLWSIAMVLVFLTTPVVVYAAGSGQVEIRNALFVIAAATFINSSLARNSLGYAVLAGLAAGFFAATKYLGLIFVVSCGLTLLLRRGGFGKTLAFSLTTAIAGFQWYYWNWLHTGDPVFPMLFNFLSEYNTAFWNNQYHANFKNYLSGEIGIEVNFLSFLVYPFLATLKDITAFDSLRAGIGPLHLLLTPFALAGVWKYRERVWRSEIATYALIAGLFYALWFFSESSQRIRHLLPVLPLVLICLSVSAIRFVENRPLCQPLIFAICLTLVFQISGHLLFTIKSAQYVFSRETRSEYLTRTVSWYEPVDWINANLTSKTKVLTMARWHAYLLNVPYFFAHQDTQTQVDLLTKPIDLTRFLNQIQNIGITHILQWPMQKDGKNLESTYFRYVHDLSNRGCLSPVKSFQVRRFASRTLASVNTGPEKMVLFKLMSAKCMVEHGYL